MHDRNDYTAGTGFHHESWQAPPRFGLARFFCIMAALGLAAAGLILIGDAILK
jgi:hypothetical protein